MMKLLAQLRLFSLAILAAISGTAQATLIGVTQRYPDVTLSQNYLIYDNDAIDQNTGLLKVVSFASVLNEGPAAGNSTLTQTYTGTGDSRPDLMLTVAVDRASGNWESSNYAGANKVTIGFGNAVISDGADLTPGFKWEGDITGFGWQEDVASTTNINEAGKFFDATWKFTNDDYEDIPANMSQFIDGVLTGAMANYEGGIKISNSAGFGQLGDAFQHDWVFGANVNSTSVRNLLSTYLTGLSSATFINSTVKADVFVPIPPAFWLWAGALISILPSLRLVKTNPSSQGV